MRQIVSREELLRLLNDALRNHPDGGPDCSFHLLYQLKDPDEEGCNWTIEILRGSGIPATECLKAAKDVVARLRKGYNLG
jgi:hypothetical protein